MPEPGVPYDPTDLNGERSYVTQLEAKRPRIVEPFSGEELGKGCVIAFTYRSRREGLSRSSPRPGGGGYRTPSTPLDTVPKRAGPEGPEHPHDGGSPTYEVT